MEQYPWPAYVIYYISLPSYILTLEIPPTPFATSDSTIAITTGISTPSLAERLTSPTAPTAEQPIRPLPRRALHPAPDWLT